VRVTDTVRDVAIETDSRRARTILLLMAVALSTGALTSATAISTVAARQVDAQLAASTINLVTVHPASAPAQTPGPADASVVSTVFPDDADARASRLSLVEAAGRSLDVSSVATVPVSRLQTDLGDGRAADRVQVVAMTPGYLAAAQIRGGPASLLGTAQRVALLGADAAKRLDVPLTSDPTGLVVWVGGYPYSVVGFLSGGTEDVSQDVVIPYQTGLALTSNDASATMLVRTAPGGGGPVAAVIRSAVRPDDPDRLASSQVADTTNLRRGVSTQLGRLAAGIGAFLLLVTVLLIANSMVVSVMSRTAEIGLRRAIGASRRGVAALVLAEGTLTGLLGGLTGAAVCSVALVVVCLVNSWTFALAPLAVLEAPLLGAAVGLIASAYPAIRAAGIQPAIAVRAE
jgi:putative ABC transport system permease protein